MPRAVFGSKPLDYNAADIYYTGTRGRTLSLGLKGSRTLEFREGHGPSILISRADGEIKAMGARAFLRELLVETTLWLLPRSARAGRWTAL